MTSIVIWSNQHEEEYFPGLWAISDSRVNNSGCILTDNFQKLTIVRGYSYADDDFYKQHPRYVFSVGFAWQHSGQCCRQRIHGRHSFRSPRD